MAVQTNIQVQVLAWTWISTTVKPSDPSVELGAEVISVWIDDMSAMFFQVGIEPWCWSRVH